jgi:hypothetical protein
MADRSYRLTISARPREDERGCRCRREDTSPRLAPASRWRTVGIPEDFLLVVESDHVKQPCQVIWRTMTRLGVQFLAA